MAHQIDTRAPMTPDPEKVARMRLVIHMIRYEDKGLAKACAEIGMSLKGFYEGLRADEANGESGHSLSQELASARMFRAEMHAETILDIADDGSNDTYEKEGQIVTNHDVIARSKLRVDTRKFILAKMVAGFGEKTTVRHEGGIGLEFGMTNLSLEQRRTALHEAGRVIEGQIVERALTVLEMTSACTPDDE